MNDITPTPGDVATQADEIALNLITNYTEFPVDGKTHAAFRSIIARALAAQRERDCAAVCEHCKAGSIPEETTEWKDFDNTCDWWHYLGGHWAECDASAIRGASE